MSLAVHRGNKAYGLLQVKQGNGRVKVQTLPTDWCLPTAADDLVVQVGRQALQVNVIVHKNILQLPGAS